MRYAILPLVPLLALLAACGRGEEPAATPSPSPAVARPSPTPAAEPTSEVTAAPTPMEAAETGGFEGFRAFARQIEAAVDASDVEFFLSRRLISTTTCPDEFEAKCQGQPDGSTVDGFWIGKWGSHVFLRTDEHLRTELSQYFATALPAALLAVAEQNRDPGNVIGPTSMAIVGPSGDSPQPVRVFQFVWLDGSWRLKALTAAPPEEWLTGDCAECYDEFEVWETAGP